MAAVGILAVATPSHGGSFQYTMSMIEALLSVDVHEYVLYTRRNNTSFDEMGLPKRELPSLMELAANGLFRRRGLFAEVDKIIAPVYSTYLLASSRPFAFTVHDMQERHFPEFFSPARRAWRWSTNHLLVRRAARVICESGFVKRDILRFIGVDDEKVVVAPSPPRSLFLERPPSAEAIEAVRARLGLPKQFLFYPAQFWPHKNHRRLLDAFAIVAREHCECRLVLTGERRYQCTTVLAHAKRLGVEDKVMHLGHLGSEDMVAVYALSTIVVIPSLFESISIPVFEAFASNVPVCASRIDGVAEQVADAAELFDPRSVSDMAAKLTRLLGSKELRRHFAAKGQRRLAEFDRKEYAGRLRAVIDSMG